MDIRTLNYEEISEINARAKAARDHPDPEQDLLDICRGGTKPEPVAGDQMELML
jgi:hypothetical protein